jgi:hypothetical protein
MHVKRPIIMNDAPRVPGIETKSRSCHSHCQNRPVTGAHIGSVRPSRELGKLRFGALFARIARGAVVAGLSVSLCAQALSASAGPPQQQSDAPAMKAPVQRPDPADVLTIPDGTLLSLKLRKDFNSETVKVGDSIEFVTAYPLRINGTVVVAQDTAASGTVTEVLPPRRSSRDARVYVAVDKIVLPDGQTATLRAQKSENKNSRNNAKEVGNHPSMWTDTSVNAGAVVPPTILVGAFTQKGRGWVYKAGSWTTAYFKGPLTIQRGALTKLEPPPYKGPALVFINGPKGKFVNLYLHLNRDTQPGPVGDEAMTGPVSLPVRIEFRPGDFSIRCHRKGGQAVELEVQDNTRYWVEYEHGKLFVKDPEPHTYEMEQLAGAPWVTYKIAKDWFSQPIRPVQP